MAYNLKVEPTKPVRSSASHAAVERQPSLLRQLGVVSATALVVSNMVGTGIFTSTGFLAGQLGDVSLVLLVWVVGALFALCGAFCYSELGVNFPSSGGEYVYLTRAYGPTWGFMTGWVSFFAGFSAPIATAALAFAYYLGYFFPALKEDAPGIVIGGGILSLKLGGAQAAACVLIAAFTVLNCFGVGRVAKIQNVLTSLKVLVILAFIVLGVTAGAGNWGNFSMKAARTTDTPIAAQLAISLFWIYVAYSGWNAATYIAEELKRPERTLPRALALGTGLVAVMYVLLNVMFIYAAPLEQMKGVFAVGSLAAKQLFGAGIAGVFSGLLAVSLMSTVNAMVTIGPRVYYAMAKNNAFFPQAARVHPRWHTPVVAIVWQGLCCMLMTLASFTSLMFYIGVLLNFCAVLSVASLFLFRKRAGWQKLPVVSFAWPLLPAVFVVVGLWMTIFGITLQPKVSIAAILTIATGAAVYHFWLKHRHPA